jgi:hypothetical protein
VTITRSSQCKSGSSRERPCIMGGRGRPRVHEDGDKSALLPPGNGSGRARR